MSETPSSDPTPQDSGPYSATPQPPATPPPPPPPGTPPPAATPPAPPAATGGTDRAMVYGILAIVFALACCPPLGILFGYLSMQEAKKTGQNDTLGKVGFWIGIAVTALWVIGGVLSLCLGWGSSMWGNDNDRYDY